MRVFVAGGTGAIGRRLVLQLIAAGHDVVATTRSIKGTDYLIRAAQQAGARRLIAQSYAGWPNIREGGAVKDENDPLDPDPPKWMRESLAAIRHVEKVVPAAEGLEGVVLRYGALYGPGTSVSTETAAMLRDRKFPLVGGGGVWSFVHVDDAAAATVAALERGRRASTTSLTTTPRRRRTGCRTWPPRSGRSRRAGCPPGSVASRPARSRSR
jgi:nucleoside-diphosphate-sugar epimerase